ncbi:Transcription factor [Cardamine amara subsp. amara]|uniref:Transcription factor n=1 Tax=Cardamine amara subsp. amara TaxID=228776 RepID=A0ABD0ZSD4_CARAN
MDEFDSLSDLPPLPQEYKPMDYYKNSIITPPSPPLESLAPFPHSDFTFSDLLQQQQLNAAEAFFPESNHLSVADSFLLDSSLSLLNRHHLTESAQFQQLFMLPDLKSLEETTTAVEDTNTNPPLFLSLSHPEVKRRKIRGSSSSSTSGSPPIENTVNRRKKISDKIRSLEKLMPWETKMSLAMVLEESYKYIKFLQSQINVMSWMPFDSVYNVYNTAGEVGDSDLLNSLTRQQILQVLANSPGSRNLLATRGVCVFSYEQLLTLKSISRNF